MARALAAILLGAALLMPAAGAAKEHGAPAAQAAAPGAAASPEALRKQAAALAAAGQYEDALAAIDAARALAPDDNDIALARARILLWSGRIGDARTQAAAVRVRAPGEPDLAAVEAAISAAAAAQRQRAGLAMSLGIADIDLRSGAGQRWESASLTGFAPLGRQLTVAASAEYEQRRTSDTRLALNLTRGTAASELRLGISATPGADFREDWGLQAGADVRLHRNLALVSDVRFADYGAVSVISLVPGLRVQTADGAHKATARLIGIFRSDGDGRAGGSLRYDGELGAGYRIFGGAASYPDTEAGVTRQLRSVFLGGGAPLSPQLSLIGAAEYDRREQSYTRKALVFSLIYRFGG